MDFPINVKLNTQTQTKFSVKLMTVDRRYQVTITMPGKVRTVRAR
jgi:hypothetical protein